MKIESRPKNVRGLGNVVELKSVTDYTLKNNSALSVETSKYNNYTVLKMRRT